MKGIPINTNNGKRNPRMAMNLHQTISRIAAITDQNREQNNLFRQLHEIIYLPVNQETETNKEVMKKSFICA